MNQQQQIRLVVKTIKVRKLTELIRFQVRHPENAHALVGISVSSSKELPIPIVFGQLELFISDPGDLAFTEELRFDSNRYRDLLENNINIPPAFEAFGWAGTNRSSFQTHYRISQAMMEGIYQDFSQESPDGIRFNAYTVNLYLHYELLNIPIT